MTNNKRLMESAIEGNNISVGILLNKGANLNYREGNGYSALTWALAFNNFDTAKLLRKNGASFDIEDAKQLHFKLENKERDFLNNAKKMEEIAVLKNDIEKATDINDLLKACEAAYKKLSKMMPRPKVARHHDPVLNIRDKSDFKRKSTTVLHDIEQKGLQM